MIDHAISYTSYCEQVLVPVWERWARPRSALREALAGGCSDERAQAMRRQRLLDAVETIMCMHHDPGMYAAACAGLAAICALHGDPDGRFWAVADQALARDREALARRAHA